MEPIGSGSGNTSVVSNGSGSGDASSVFVGSLAVTVVESVEPARETEI